MHSLTNPTYHLNQFYKGEIMIKKLLEDNLVYFAPETDTWEKAVQEASKSLLEENYIEQSYVEEIVQCIKDNGPYIVILPGIAMPHATVGASGVLKTGISLTVFPNMVQFEDDKEARLFFTLATNNAEEHLKNIQNLMELLMDEDTLEKLMDVYTIEDLKQISGGI